MREGLYCIGKFCHFLMIFVGFEWVQSVLRCVISWFFSCIFLYLYTCIYIMYEDASENACHPPNLVTVTLNCVTLSFHVCMRCHNV